MYNIVNKLLFILITIALTCSITFASSASNRKYDTYFYKQNKAYFGANMDWRLQKAQAIQESGLNPNAQSPVGARGLMQFMPKTQEEQSKKLKITADVHDPAQNIAAGIYYDKYLQNNQKAKRSFEDRLSFTQASYNGGLGNVLKAQKLCILMDEVAIDCNSQFAITLYASEIKSWQCKESLDYVQRIFNIYNKLIQ